MNEKFCAEQGSYYILKFKWHPIKVRCMEFSSFRCSKNIYLFAAMLYFPFFCMNVYVYTLFKKDGLCSFFLTAIHPVRQSLNR